MTHTVPPGNPEAPTTPAATAPGPAASVSGHDTAADRGLPAALKRRVPKYADLAPLMQFKKPEFSRAARLRRASTIWDLRDMAKRRTPQAPFDYTDGAAEAEISLRRARQAFLDIEFRPGVLRDVSSIDLNTDILGGPSLLPLAIPVAVATAASAPSRSASLSSRQRTVGLPSRAYIKWGAPCRHDSSPSYDRNPKVAFW